MMSPFLTRPRYLLGLTVTLLALAIGGCKKNQQAPAAQGPLEASTLTVKTEAVPVTQELPGRLSASRVAQIRARISGIVQKRLFTEGADVKEGDVLFEIDPAPYEAALDSARATLARGEAGLASAKVQAERFKELVATNAISKQNYDNAVASQLGLAADVAAGKAAVRTAEINLGYTRVTSPISGRIGRAEVTEGAYVQQGSATLLAVVQQLDPLYIDLTQSAEDVLNLKNAIESGQVKRENGDVKVDVVLANGSSHKEQGSLQFSDVSVDPTTGNVTLRGTVPNPGVTLFPGMFVRARINAGTDPAAILIPQSAVSRNTKGEATALVIGDDQKVALRTLRTSRAVGNRWLVTEGLKPGDQVILDNLQKLRPGAPVKARAAAPAGESNSPVSQGQAQATR